MARVYLLFEVITISFAFAAAWFWFRSSQVFGPEINFTDFAAVKPWLDEIAHFNREATLCAAVSALAHGSSYVIVRLGI